MSNKKEQEVPLTVDTGEVEPHALEVVEEVAQQQSDKGSLKAIIEAHGSEESKPTSGKKTLGKVLGGDILTSSFVKRQLWLLLLLTTFIIVYISNGYVYKNSVVEIDNLIFKIKQAKLESLNSTSKLAKYTRESRVLQILQETNDSLLQKTNIPPTIIYDTQE